MPKLWVGFLKCVSQTQPHSFRVLLQVIDGLFVYGKFLVTFDLQLSKVVYCLQLPAPQLESALNKHANLRGPLSAYASQPSVKSSLPRYNFEHMYWCIIG